jgi:hypothetical protein
VALANFAGRMNQTAGWRQARLQQKPRSIFLVRVRPYGPCNSALIALASG